MSELIIDGYRISEDIETIVRKVKSELINGKLTDIEPEGDNIKVTCPCNDHKNGHESTPSCFVYNGKSKDVEYGWFKCFGCGSQGPLYSFVAHCFDRSDEFGKK